MSIQRQTRQVGDRLTSIAAALKRPDNTAVDLTSLTVKFKMTSSEGVEKVAETASNVTVTDASAGECQYDPQAADVDTEGTFYAYFTVTAGSGNKDTFPSRTGEFEIAIMADA